MTNSVVENFFADEAGLSFARMMAAGQGVPTARLETDFHAPSRLGDRLEFTLAVTRIGGASVSLMLTEDQTSVLIDQGGRAVAEVEQVRAAGLKLYVWTVNKPEDARRLAALGLDGITTDDPVMLREALKP
jgi:4-hydroxybenzoyl-CoA thioesterase